MTSVLPNVDISPKGLRELEAWLRRPEKKDEPDQWYYVLPYAPATKPADYRVADPHPDFEGAWGNASSSDFATAFGVSRIGRQKKLWLKLAVTGGEDDPGSTIFTLPATFRPEKTHRMICRQGETDGATIDVNPDGTVVYVGKLTAVTAAAIVDAGGIIYDFENVGDYLHILANGDGAVQAINLETDGATAFDGIRISSAQDLSMYAAGSSARLEGQTQMDLAVNDSSGPMFLTTNDGDISLGAGAADINLVTDGPELHLVGAAGATLNAFGAPIQLLNGEGILLDVNDSFNIDLALGGSTAAVRVKDSGGNVIARIDEDGTLHLKAGASIIYDLP